MKKKTEQYVRASRNSTAIVEQLAKTRIRQIFELLDDDQDGIISAQSIALENLSAVALEAFRPLFLELEELDVSLNFEQFEDASLRLMKVIFVLRLNLFQESLMIQTMNKGLKSEILTGKKIKFEDKNASQTKFSFQVTIEVKMVE